MRDPLTLELRVLNGRHAGACAVARDALLLGVTPEADLIVTDLDARAGLGKLYLMDGGRWLIAAANAEPSANDLENAPKVGVPIHWAGVALVVCEPHTDWPSMPVTAAPSEFAGEPGLLHGELGGHAHLGLDADFNEPMPKDGATVSGPALMKVRGAAVAPVPPPRNALRPVLWILAALLGILALLGLAAYISGRVPLEPSGVSAPTSPALPDMTAQAQKQVPDLALAIAKVDSTLRLQLTPQRDGLVRVSGWVDSLQQLDRLADALAMRRPSPVMRVLVVSDVRSELSAQLAGAYSHLRFLPGDPGVLRVQGIVASAAVRQETLTAVRPHLPSGLILADELKLAEQLAPEIRAALVSAGFKDVKAGWDGKQVWATLSLPASARNRFEEFLIELADRFPGLPLRVTPTLLTASGSTGLSKAPFAILGVVGGDVPYVVLPGGAKLLPGGSHGGWRLQAIDADVLVFDSPRRLVVSR
ncbi:MAG: type III secretion system inner membrane ring subunit SctD [Comamonadaceae bacterium]|nr:type III secretion system inner membrane ring subunit SctD [Comamonadaceae bacterium]